MPWAGPWVLKVYELLYHHGREGTLLLESNLELLMSERNDAQDLLQNILEGGCEETRGR